MPRSAKSSRAWPAGLDPAGTRHPPGTEQALSSNGPLPAYPGLPSEYGCPQAAPRPSPVTTQERGGSPGLPLCLPASVSEKRCSQGARPSDHHPLRPDEALPVCALALGSPPGSARGCLRLRACAEPQMSVRLWSRRLSSVAGTPAERLSGMGQPSAQLRSGHCCCAAIRPPQHSPGRLVAARELHLPSTAVEASPIGTPPSSRAHFL